MVYVATLAPGVTLWDAGEFLAAIHSLGIPHPPGTPLYVIIGSVWGREAGSLLGFARAINFLSALATIVGCAVLGTSVARWTTSRVAGIAAGIAAGAMLSVWRSATETEVYALSFALALIALAIGDRAGNTSRWRDAVLAMYVLALAVPLHLSALVVAPGVVLFAATDASGALRRSTCVVLSGAALLAMALGTTAPALAIGGVIVMIVGSLTRTDRDLRMRLRDVAGMTGVLLLAASAVGVMYFRARHDPFVNQGNPATLDALFGVVGREQYDVPPLWPRRVPFWLQLGNLVQYADWQVAFGLDQWVGASVRRTPFTLLFVALAIAGARWHRVRDRRSFRAFGVAFASASLGAIVVLNLRAGPSFGVGVLPDDALHEARERDYFFGIAFAMGAAWAGMGAARFGHWLASRWRLTAVGAVSALAFAVTPVLLNWRAADRSREGSPTLAHRFAAKLLDVAPPNAVLLVAGDNDTYPLWYLQRVEGRRRDVTVVTIPLLPAMWYRMELQRRHALLSDPYVDSWRGLQASIAAVGAQVRELGRPLAVAATVPVDQREALGSRWIARGLVYVRWSSDTMLPAGAVGVRTTGDSLTTVPIGRADVIVDTVTIAVGEPNSASLGTMDPTAAYVAAMLSCPRQILAVVRAHSGSVDPRCNLR